MKTQMRTTLSLILFLSITLYMPSYDNHAMSASTRSAPLESLNGHGWHIETVDEKGGIYSALALDDNGYPHIAYQAESTTAFFHELNYARWTGSNWVIDVVDTQGDTGWVLDSLALDNAGNPHIGYGGHQFSNLKYAYWTGTDWIIEDVDDPNAISYSGASFALDLDGYPHFAYCAQNPLLKQELRYAHWTGLDWSIEVIDSAGCWYSTSIGLDANDVPGISYYDENHGELKYARWTGSEWDVQVVDHDGNTGQPNSLAFDTNGYPHISYYSFTYDKLKYAEWTGVSWEIKDVDRIGGDIYYIDIALVLDAGNRPNIAYVDGTTKTVKYSYLAGDVWVIETVDSGDSSVSIRLDDAGNPHISYTNASLGLKYAVGSPLLPIYLPLIHMQPLR